MAWLPVGRPGPGLDARYGAGGGEVAPRGDRAYARAPPEAATDEDLYETDFYTWTQRQAEHLRAGRIDAADLVNIAEEIESLGKSQASALRSAYRLIAMHLLKLIFQSSHAMTRIWRATITRDRLDIEQHFADSPGLKPRRAELFEQAYRAARREADAETGLPLGRFPVDPPFTVDQAEDEDFWPAPPP